MSQQESEENQRMLQDSSTIFSEEEWKLLQDWQKELYRNVMKEIHQALLSLGPLIAATVCSLQTKEKSDVCPTYNQDPESKHRLHPSPDDTRAEPDGLFKEADGEELHPHTPQDSDSQEDGDSVSIGFPFLNADMCLRKEEPVSILIDDYGAEIRENSTDHTSGYEVVSFRVKKEDEFYLPDHKDRRRMKRTGSPSGVGNINRKMKMEDSIKFSERAPPCKSLSATMNTRVLHSANEDTNLRSQIWSECYQELRGTKPTPSESSFRNHVHFSLHTGDPRVRRSNSGDPNIQISDPGDPHMRSLDLGDSNISRSYLGDPLLRRSEPGDPNIWRSDTDNGYESNEIYSQVSNTQQTQRANACIGGSKGYSVKEAFHSNGKINSRAKHFTGTDCAKLVFSKSHLNTPHKIDSTEKPHACTFCDKRFNRKYNLDDHIRIHTGERPYKCTKCDKTFIQKSHLNEHHRKHT
ncbi:zinc finger protein 777-like isoform X2 [Pleurodeles waltl]|uniref:zinc finger protein 777-like isoform X2 n=1 Tax=Pleurodeles waltl TaxID=8319 RepID=UPI0037097831